MAGPRWRGVGAGGKLVVVIRSLVLMFGSFVAMTGQLVTIGDKAPLGKAQMQGPAVLMFVAECVDVPKIPEIKFAWVGELTCSPAGVRLADPDGRIARSLDIRAGQRAAVLIDDGGFVRRIVRAGSRSEFEGAVQADVKAWIHGKAIYESQCARCHGADGLDTSYQGSKSLGGLGRRTSEAGILELTERTGVVDLSGLTAEQRRALAVYVAGL